MADICNDCGLPQELCVCTDIDRSESPEVEIGIDERRFGKEMTVIDGIANDDLDDLSSELKGAVGAGGTTEEDGGDLTGGRILIQGDHRGKERIVDIIEDYGYEVV